MDLLMLASFMDELTKISEASPTKASAGNALAPVGMKSGMGSNSVVSPTSKVGITSSKTSANPIKGNLAAKPTNYSIVHSSSPTAAYGSAAATSKSIPPPPVRT
jgi:hypothetical protein